MEYSLLNFVVYAFGTLFVNLFCIYCWKSLLNISFSQFRVVVAILLMIIIGVVFNFFCPRVIKFIFSFIFLILIVYFLFCRNVVKSFLCVVVSQLIIMIADLSYAVVGSLFLNFNITFLENFSLSVEGSLLLNIYIAFISFLLIKSGIPLKIYNIILSLSFIKKRRDIIIYCLMIFLVIIISTVESCMNWPFFIVFITNTVMTLIFLFMVIKFAISENNYNQMNIKYRTSLSSLQEYGDMLDRYRIYTHENDNHLRTIQNMTTDDNVIRYIESLLSESKKTSGKVLKKIVQIPDGEVRALIHAKLCKMEECKIKFKLNVSRDVKTVDLIDMDDYIKRDVCTILGVYLDNAIEAVNLYKKKNMNIEFYIVNNYLYIDISNNFEGVIDISKFGKNKISTKGEEHGYGLMLVDKIVKDNSSVDNETLVVKNIITQRVKIKM